MTVWTPPWAGAAELAITDALGLNQVRPEWFYQTSDGADDYPSFARAIAALEGGSGNVGGIIQLGRRDYTWSQPVILTKPGMGLVGEGAGIFANPVPAYISPTRIIIDHTDGPGVWAKGQGSILDGFTVVGSAARKAAAYDIEQPGIRLEAPDAAGDRADKCSIRRVVVRDQPGDGLLAVGTTIQSDIGLIDIANCRGMGVRLDPGSQTGIVRSHPNYPGLVTLRDIRVGWVGGNALAISNPGVTTQAGMGIRVKVDQLDCFNTCNDEDVYYDDYAVWAFGENIDFVNCGFGGARGWVGESVLESVGGIYIAGRDNRLLNNRYIQTRQPVMWGHRSAQPSTGLYIEGLRTTQTNLTHDYFCAVESAAAQGLHIRYDRSDGFNAVAPTKVGGVALQNVITEFQGSVSLFGARHRAGNYSSGRAIPLGIGEVAAIELVGMPNGFASGTITLTSNSVNGGGGVFQFRVGSSFVAVEKWAGSANWVVGPNAGSGPLTGITGLVGKVVISAHSDRKIYIENQRGYPIELQYMVANLTASAMVSADQ